MSGLYLGYIRILNGWIFTIIWLSLKHSRKSFRTSARPNCIQCGTSSPEVQERWQLKNPIAWNHIGWSYVIIPVIWTSIAHHRVIPVLHRLRSHVQQWIQLHKPSSPVAKHCCWEAQLMSKHTEEGKPFGNVVRPRSFKLETSLGGIVHRSCSKHLNCRVRSLSQYLLAV